MNGQSASGTDRSKVTTIRLTVGERTLLEQAAARRGQTISAFLREAGLAAAEGGVDAARAHAGVTLASHTLASHPVVQIPSVSMLGALSLLTSVPVTNGDNPGGLHDRACSGCHGAGTNRTCALRGNPDVILRFGLGRP